MLVLQELFRCLLKVGPRKYSSCLSTVCFPGLQLGLFLFDPIGGGGGREALSLGDYLVSFSYFSSGQTTEEPKVESKMVLSTS